MARSPLATVKDGFGGKDKLVEQLAGMVDKLSGDSTQEQVKSRLMGLSNKKLLRLYKVEQTVRERFGDRGKLVEHIMDARKKAGLTADNAYRQKLEGFTKARLLDLAKQKLGTATKKQTPEAKLSAKRGRKARSRALDAIAKKH